MRPEEDVARCGQGVYEEPVQKPEINALYGVSWSVRTETVPLRSKPTGSQNAVHIILLAGRYRSGVLKIPEYPRENDLFAVMVEIFPREDTLPY